MPEESIDEVYRAYYETGTTDGLPVIPPTDDRVERMLEGTDLDAEAELGRLGDRGGILTVETVAVNGVMAGCLPIHMPVLIAGARAQVAPESEMIEAAVGTDSSGHLYLLNGPIRETLDVNAGTGAFGPGFRSNRTIGRALGLVLQNTADLHPGEQVMGVIGNPFRDGLVAGENEEASPWEPFHVERGHDPERSTITVANVNCFVQSSNYGRNKTPTGVLSRLVHNTPAQLGFRDGAVYVISPANADVLSDRSKREVKEYIHENAVAPTGSFSEPGGRRRTPDPDALTDVYSRIHDDPADIEVIVAGGEGAWNAVLGPMEGGPTTVEIDLPDRWDGLCDEYASHLDRGWGPQRGG
ncbi:MAG: hypothetical protein ABEH78_04770 [Haloferacaceae archaeon]